MTMTSRRPARVSALLPALLIALACKPTAPGETETEGSDSSSETGTTSTTSGATETGESVGSDTTAGTTAGPDSSTGATMTSTTTGAPATGGLDILFVVDNSGSMGDVQRQLGAGAGALVDALTGVDYRIAVTTTDFGNPRCTPDNFPRPANQGRFEITSCRAHLQDFTWDPVMLDATAACTDICAHDSWTISPSAIDADGSVEERFWIESIGGETNIDVPVDEALACLLPQGVNGCGFESQLESMYWALARAGEPGELNYGFLRDGADLLVIIISDEVDCSYVPAQQNIFLDLNNTWSWEEGASSPTSAVCWNAGVDCDGVAPGPYISCDAVDKNINGSAPADDGDAVLHPLGKYSTYLQDLELEKLEGAVHFAAIVGVPDGYAAGEAELVYMDSLDQADQIAFGIGPGCVAGEVTGRPPVRMRELAEEVGGPGLYSVCKADLGSALAAMVQAISG